MFSFGCAQETANIDVRITCPMMHLRHNTSGVGKAEIATCVIIIQGNFNLYVGRILVCRRVLKSAVAHGRHRRLRCGYWRGHWCWNRRWCRCGCWCRHCGIRDAAGRHQSKHQHRCNSHKMDVRANRPAHPDHTKIRPEAPCSSCNGDQRWTQQRQSH